jgi:hypothetical protein
MGNDDSLRDDHDSPWKEALSNRFPEFLALLFPEIHADVDWSRGHDFLDTELQKVIPDAGTGRRHTDKLVKVSMLDGAQTWMLIHVEVQGEPEQDFAERMFVYYYRLRDRYAVRIVSLAVLADTARNFRPDSYSDMYRGGGISFRFHVAKLLDWDSPERWQTLENSDNIFAFVVMAQIRAKATRDVEARKAWKIRLVRLLYEKGYRRAIIAELLLIIDWMIRLPKGAEGIFWREVHELGEPTNMPYVLSIERLGIEKGIQQGQAALLLRQIARKYGEEAVETYRDRIEQADAETLLTWSERILTADRVEAIFQS